LKNTAGDGLEIVADHALAAFETLRAHLLRG
jgi:hypothetical protein